MTEQIRNFFVQARLNYKGLFFWLNWRGYLSSVVVYPAMEVAIYVLLGRFMIDDSAALQFAMGASVISMAFVVIGGIGQTYAYDRQLFTMSFVFVSPVNRFLNYLSRAVFHYPNALLAFFCSILTLWLLTDISFSSVNWAVGVLAALVIAASLCAYAQFLSIFIIITRNWMMTLSLSLGLVVVFTGAIIPISYFPVPLQVFARLLPVTNGLSILRLSITGVAIGDVYLQILREALIGLVYLVVGAIGFVVFERVAKKTGLMETELSA